MRRILALALLSVVLTSPAAALKAGDGMLGVQVTNGIADLYDATDPTPAYISAYDHSELGIGLQYWRLMSADYAFTLSGGLGFFSESNKPGTNAPTGATEFKYSQSSWNFRVGGDRMVQCGDRAIIYFGPGVEYWNGTAKWEGGSFTTARESEPVSRFAVSGRVGGMLNLNDKTAFNCQVGRYVGYASAEDTGAKATWWPSGFQASGGLVFKF